MHLENLKKLSDGLHQLDSDLDHAKSMNRAIELAIAEAESTLNIVPNQTPTIKLVLEDMNLARSFIITQRVFFAKTEELFQTLDALADDMRTAEGARVAATMVPM